MRHLTLTMATLLSLTSCGGDALSQSWQLDRLRILGVRATPAEPQPGDVVTFESLVYVPQGETLGGVVWFACLPSSASDFGCELDTSVLDDLDSLDPENMSPEELMELLDRVRDAGLIGYEPGFAPVWTAPADALDGLDAAQALEGVSALVNLTAMPEGAADNTDAEIAYKRLPISLATTPNHNPTLIDFTVEGTSLNDCLAAPDDCALDVEDGHLVFPICTADDLERDSACGVELIPTFADGDIETYTFRNSDGAEEERVEEPYVTWYTEGGEFDQPYSLYPEIQVKWTPPESGFTGVIVSVARDRRGGMAWRSIPVIVR